MKIQFSKDYPILIERGNYYTHCGQAGNDEPERSFNTPNLSVKEQFKYIFDEVLEVDPSEFRVVLLKDTFTPQETLHEEIKLLFDEFNVKACSFVNSQIGYFMMWINRGLNGIVIDIGQSNTKFIPVVNMMPQKEHCVEFRFGGSTIENYIYDYLVQNGIERNLIDNNRNILLPLLMKNYFYFDIGSEFDFEKKQISKRKNELNNAFVFNDCEGNEQSISLSNPILPEELIIGTDDTKDFSLSTKFIEQLKVTMEKYGTSFHSLFETEADPYAYWWVGKVIICGGGSNVLGLRSLLIREILKSPHFNKTENQHREPHCPFVDIDFKKIVFTIHNVPTEPIFVSWIGGSMVSCFNAFKNTYITKEMYESNPKVTLLIDDKEVWKTLFEFIE